MVAQKSCFFRLCNSIFQTADCQRIFCTNVDITFIRAYSVSCQRHTFDHLVRVAFHDTSVHKCARIAFVTVTDNVTFLLFLSSNLGPLFARRETCTASAAKTCRQHLIDDLLRAHFK